MLPALTNQCGLRSPCFAGPHTAGWPRPPTTASLTPARPHAREVWRTTGAYPYSLRTDEGRLQAALLRTVALTDMRRLGRVPANGGLVRQCKGGGS